MTSTTVKHLNQTYIREVNVNYRLTTQQLLAVTDPMQVARFISSIMPDNSREHFIALYLDGSHQIVSYSLISTGVANQALVHPREIFQRAVVVGSCAIIVAHNHPSGNLQPSDADKQATEYISKAGEVLGIKLLDSLIITWNSTYSIINDHVTYIEKQ
ncbi:MAG: JAB domain-containing protein [Pirellulaceae bacterium]|nr:JAB domain-containing protein [Pirellulaceae bacterium]